VQVTIYDAESHERMLNLSARAHSSLLGKMLRVKEVFELERGRGDNVCRVSMKGTTNVAILMIAIVVMLFLFALIGTAIYLAAGV
jgi:hypothetical protein